MKTFCFRFLTVGNSFNPLPEEDDIAEAKSSKTSLKQKQKKKVKKKQSRTHSSSDTSSNEDASANPRDTRIPNQNSMKNNSNIVVEFNPLKSSIEKSDDPPSLIEKERHIELPPLKKTQQNSENHDTTISPFSPEHNEEKQSDTLNTRQSIDSVQLKTDANHFVNSIMAQALQQMENKNENNDLHETTNSNTSKKSRDLETASVSSTNVDDQAKGLVGNILNNALFIVSSDKK